MASDRTAVLEVTQRWIQIVNALAEAGIEADATTVLALAMGVQSFGIPVGSNASATARVQGTPVVGFMPPVKR